MAVNSAAVSRVADAGHSRDEDGRRLPRHNQTRGTHQCLELLLAAHHHAVVAGHCYEGAGAVPHRWLAAGWPPAPPGHQRCTRLDRPDAPVRQRLVHLWQGPSPSPTDDILGTTVDARSSPGHPGLRRCRMRGRASPSGGLGRPAARRCGGRLAASPVWTCAGRLALRGPGGQGRLPGCTEHWFADAGRSPWSVPQRRLRPGPTHDVRDHR